MSLVPQKDRGFLEALSRLAYCNPFTAERIELERLALGASFDERASAWSKQSEWESERPNIVKLRKHIEDNPAKPKWITSVRTIGYKFNG